MLTFGMGFLHLLIRILLPGKEIEDKRTGRSHSKNTLSRLSFSFLK